MREPLHYTYDGRDRAWLGVQLRDVIWTVAGGALFGALAILHSFWTPAANGQLAGLAVAAAVLAGVVAGGALCLADRGRALLACSLLSVMAGGLLYLYWPAPGEQRFLLAHYALPSVALLLLEAIVLLAIAAARRPR